MWGLVLGLATANVFADIAFPVCHVGVLLFTLYALVHALMHVVVAPQFSGEERMYEDYKRGTSFAMSVYGQVGLCVLILLLITVPEPWVIGSAVLLFKLSLVLMLLVCSLLSIVDIVQGCLERKAKKAAGKESFEGEEHDEIETERGTE
eukprot:TRINITY_DN3757_c0_g3_i2.p2 TRINITY_DN3757_c0_g3~~TRINITY_DN3757_c0_g3_i2.p2  ORF type:complete len:149 (+),score=37.40 TRINITY_DN3757_c0_g3_i2:613-1059(+)